MTGRGDFLVGFAKKLIAAVTVNTVVHSGEESKEIIKYELPVQWSYVYCARCKEELFLDADMARNADAIRCPNCGVINLLGDIMGVRSRRKIRIAQKRVTQESGNE